MTFGSLSLRQALEPEPERGDLGSLHKRVTRSPPCHFCAVDVTTTPYFAGDLTQAQNTKITVSIAFPKISST